MELSINLKTVSEQISNDGGVVRLNFVGDNDDIAQVDLLVSNLRGLARYIDQLADKYALPVSTLFSDPAA
ncbi:MAG: hypothetical protein C0434_05220 [Xanthomonadaceae bacterium]|nr:hypothetical protein [Xanthomonadaceae bacterium]